MEESSNMRVFLMTVCLAGSLFAQGQQPNTAAQREAMKKLSFLVGKWSGPATVVRGPGEPLRITQSEDIQMKLEGLLMTIEGTGRDKDGKVVFGAFSTVTYDDATGTYRIRANNDGRFLDTELKVTANGFEWGYTAGPLKVANVMKVDEKGEWSEVTESTYGNTPPRRSVEMQLKRQ
jgi:protocatechuate 3,4-dioxygenase beta subunit